ncbi:MAG: AAA family ATPase [Thermotogota bacterium]
MKPSDVKFLSKKIMQSDEVPLLWGHFGVGKTDIAKQIAEETGRELIILVISQMEPGDLIGMPSRDENKTTFLKPDWWPENENSIILIDEINRAHRSIRNAIMQLLIDRRIHNHILPEDCWIMAAANPPDEEYDQVELITDPAFMSRFFHLDISPNDKDWIDWAKKEGIDNNTINFIENYPEYLSNDNQISIRLDLRPSPRSWFKLSRVLNNLEEENIKKYGYSLAAGIVGSDSARAYINNLNNKTTLPKPEDVILYGKSFDRLEKLSDEEKINMIMRINNYIERIQESEMINIIDNNEHQTIAKNIKAISEFIPKDSIFSILRNLNNLVEKSKGLKRAFYDKLMEEIALTLGDEQWLQEI